MKLEWWSSDPRLKRFFLTYMQAGIMKGVSEINKIDYFAK